MGCSVPLSSVSKQQVSVWFVSKLRALTEMWSDLMAQDWSVVKGFLQGSQIWLSQASAQSVSYFQKWPAVLLHVIHILLLVFYYLHIILTGWYLKPEWLRHWHMPRRDSGTDFRAYQVCLQSFSLSVHQCHQSVCLNMPPFISVSISLEWAFKFTESAFILMFF